jgi:ABC-2 type transport system permease protein
MNKLWPLIRVSLKVNFGLSVLRDRLFKKKKDIWMVPLIALAVLGLFPALYGYLKLIKYIYGILQPMGQEHAILTFGILAGQFVILLFGLYYVISAFYFSKDLQILVPLPLKPFAVMLSKFTVILVNEYLTVAVLVLPVLIYFGVLSKGGPAYWIKALIVYLLLPVIPLAIVSLLVVSMMRLINLSRKKDALIIVGSLILIAAGLSLQLGLGVSRSRGLNPDPQVMIRFFASPDSLLTKVGAGFPPSIWATKTLVGGLTGPGLLNLLIFAGTSLALFYGIPVMAEKLFYRGLIGIGEISGRRKTISQKDMARQVSSGRRPIKAIFLREWRIMNRTPIFLLNGSLTSLLFPLIIVLITKTGRGYAAFFLRAIGSGTSIYVTLGAAAFMIFCGCLNGTASSTFSREGSQFWMSKVIPVSPREQVIAKFLHSYIIALLGAVTASVVLVVVLHMKAAACAAAIILALITGIILNVIGMIIDLARPLLEWTNPQKAIKQNLNVLFAVFADLGVLSILWLFVHFMVRAGIAGSVILIVLFAALVLLSLVSFQFLLKFAAKRYNAIEV